MLSIQINKEFKKNETYKYKSRHIKKKIILVAITWLNVYLSIVFHGDYYVSFIEDKNTSMIKQLLTGSAKRASSMQNVQILKW